MLLMLLIDVFTFNSQLFYLLLVYLNIKGMPFLKIGGAVQVIERNVESVQNMRLLSSASVESVKTWDFFLRPQWKVFKTCDFFLRSQWTVLKNMRTSFFGLSGQC